MVRFDLTVRAGSPHSLGIWLSDASAEVCDESRRVIQGVIPILSNFTAHAIIRPNHPPIFTTKNARHLQPAAFFELFFRFAGRFLRVFTV